jgi:hypothetical protein
MQAKSGFIETNAKGYGKPRIKEKKQAPNQKGACPEGEKE